MPWLVVLLVILAVAIGVYFYLKNETSRLVLLMGNSGTGKTKIFKLLKAKKFNTVTSIEPNTYQTGDLKIIDLPGHAKLKFHRDSLVEKATCIFYFAIPGDDQFTEDLEDILCTCNCPVYFVGSTEFTEPRLIQIEDPLPILRKLLPLDNKEHNG